MVVPSYYVPLLRWRMGEYQALRRLNDGVRAKTVPLVEVLPPDYDFELHKPKKHINEQLEPFVKQVAKNWSGRPAMIDTVQIPASTRMSDGRHPLTFIFDDARLQGVPLSPVTALDRDGDGHGRARQDRLGGMLVDLLTGEHGLVEPGQTHDLGIERTARILQPAVSLADGREPDGMHDANVDEGAN